MNTKKKLAIIHNGVLIGLAYFASLGFYMHQAFYSWPFDWSAVRAIDVKAVSVLTLVVFIYMKAWHFVEERAEYFDFKWG